MATDETRFFVAVVVITVPSVLPLCLLRQWCSSSTDTCPSFVVLAHIHALPVHNFCRQPVCAVHHCPLCSLLCSTMMIVDLDSILVRCACVLTSIFLFVSFFARFSFVLSHSLSFGMFLHVSWVECFIMTCMGSDDSACSSAIFHHASFHELTTRIIMCGHDARKYTLPFVVFNIYLATVHSFHNCSRFGIPRRSFDFAHEFCVPLLVSDNLWVVRAATAPSEVKTTSKHSKRMCWL